MQTIILRCHLFRAKMDLYFNILGVRHRHCLVPAAAYGGPLVLVHDVRCAHYDQKEIITGFAWVSLPEASHRFQSHPNFYVSPIDNYFFATVSSVVLLWLSVGKTTTKLPLIDKSITSRPYMANRTTHP